MRRLEPLCLAPGRSPENLGGRWGRGGGGNSGLGEAVLVKLLKELKAALGHAGGWGRVVQPLGAARGDPPGSLAAESAGRKG